MTTWCAQLRPGGGVLRCRHRAPSAQRPRSAASSCRSTRCRCTPPVRARTAGTARRGLRVVSASAKPPPAAGAQVTPRAGRSSAAGDARETPGRCRCRAAARMVLRTAASTRTARLRPASTAITTLRTGCPRMSSIQRLVGQALELALHGLLAHQVHDQLQAHLAPHGGLAEDGLECPAGRCRGPPAGSSAVPGSGPSMAVCETR
jgi:hypothetical protein